MQYEPTEDIEYVTRCLTSPSVWRMGTDDGLKNADPDLLFITKGNDFWLRTPHGVFICKPTNCISYDCHVALLPQAAGMAVEICRGGIAWMFGNTQCLRLTASIPEYNKLAIRLARKVEMRFIGINQKSYLKNGILYNQVLYGISKGE